MGIKLCAVYVCVSKLMYSVNKYLCKIEGVHYPLIVLFCFTNHCGKQSNRHFALLSFYFSRPSPNLCALLLSLFAMPLLEASQQKKHFSS